MKRNIFFIFIIFSTSFLKASDFNFYSNDSYTFNSSNSIITTGLNPVTGQPLNNSDWKVANSSPNAGNCSALSSAGYVYNFGTQNLTDVQYVPTSNTTCSGVTLLGDVNHITTYTNAGTVQEAFFPSQTYTCNSSSSCPATLSITNTNQNFANFQPTQGQNGTDAGVVKLFTYNYSNLNFTTGNGTGGIGGTANMPVQSPVTKYCIYKRDLTTDVASSSYASNPIVNIDIIQWVPYVQGVNGGIGTSSTNTTNQSKVIKGLDYSQIYWLGNDNIINFGQAGY